MLVGEGSDADKITAKLHQFTSNYSVAVTLPVNGMMEGTFDPAEDLNNGKWSTDRTDVWS